MLAGMDLGHRAQAHAALGDAARLRMVDELVLGDRTFRQLADAAGLAGNAAAHHLAVLESAGLIERRTSEGDRRRRYIRLRAAALAGLIARPLRVDGRILFVCTHNSARSQFAAALWRQRTGAVAGSAGSRPAARVHPGAIRAAVRYGIDFGAATPRGYASVSDDPDLVVSVCDRALEGGIPFDAPLLHWSIPDPVRAGTASAFRRSFDEIAERIETLANATA
jgi:protein-tyrosine-phosphatase/DNA-binding transcriptional ArsR family regulator